MKGKKIMPYQVRNSDGYPASNDHDDLCIFPTLKVAKKYIRYLMTECGYYLPETFTTHKVIIKEV